RRGPVHQPDGLLADLSEHPRGQVLLPSREVEVDRATRRLGLVDDLEHGHVAVAPLAQQFLASLHHPRLSVALPGHLNLLVPSLLDAYDPRDSASHDPVVIERLTSLPVRCVHLGRRVPPPTNLSTGSTSEKKRPFFH